MGRPVDGQSDIILATRNGQAARFHEHEVRPMGRDTMGVTGIRLKKGDEVIGMEIVQPSAELLVVTEQGFGKRTPLDDFPVKHRATGGVIANSLNRDTGDVAAVRVVGREDEEMMLITEEGTILRTEVSSVNRYRRASRGVTVMRPSDGDRSIGIVDDRLSLGRRSRSDAVAASGGNRYSRVYQWWRRPGPGSCAGGGRLESTGRDRARRSTCTPTSSASTPATPTGRWPS